MARTRAASRDAGGSRAWRRSTGPTVGEWIELSRAMPADTPTPPVLTALSLGEQVDPFDAWSAINIDWLR